MARATPPHPMVIVLGMPKSGTGTISSFLRCNGWHSSHWSCGKKFCGDCMLRWVAQMSRSHMADGTAQLKEECGDFNAFAQLDYEPMGSCIFPQVNHLHTLIRYLPDACFVLNTRPTEHWLASVASHSDMMSRLTRYCPIYPRTRAGLGQWYDAIKLRASQALRSSAKCSIEFDIEDSVGLTMHLDRFFGLNSSNSCLATHLHTTKRAPWPAIPPSPLSPPLSPPPPRPASLLVPPKQ